MTSYRGEHADRIENIGDRSISAMRTSAAELGELLDGKDLGPETRKVLARVKANLELHQRVLRCAVRKQSTRFDGRTEELKGEAA